MSKPISKSLLMLLLFVSVTYVGCRPEPEPPITSSSEPPGIEIREVIRSGDYTENTKSETVTQNNCTNQSPLSFSIERQRTLAESTELSLSGEIGGEISAEIKPLGVGTEGKIVAAIGAEYRQSAEQSIMDGGGLGFTIEAGANPTYKINWKESWEEGIVKVEYNGQLIDVPYKYLVSARPELVDTIYEICPNESQSEEVVEANTKVNPTPIPSKTPLATYSGWQKIYVSDLNNGNNWSKRPQISNNEVLTFSPNTGGEIWATDFSNSLGDFLLSATFSYDTQKRDNIGPGIIIGDSTSGDFFLFSWNPRESNTVWFFVNVANYNHTGTETFTVGQEEVYTIQLMRTGETLTYIVNDSVIGTRQDTLFYGNPREMQIGIYSDGEGVVLELHELFLAVPQNP